MKNFNRNCPCCGEKYNIFSLHNKTITLTCKEQKDNKCLYCKTCLNQIKSSQKKYIYYLHEFFILLFALVLSITVRNYLNFLPNFDVLLASLPFFISILIIIYIFKYLFLQLKCFHNEQLSIDTNSNPNNTNLNYSNTFELNNIHGILDDNEKKVLEKTMGVIFYIQVLLFSIIAIIFLILAIF